ncbi:MAG TPA: replication-associated recombination protein A [Solirubrobacteraceae bacterium]|nr:replication-associated recombination protein A [Solirubrobacteraceae bacterium]
MQRLFEDDASAARQAEDGDVADRTGTSGHGRAEPPGHGSRPLAVRARPTSLQEFVGQDHLLGPGSALRRAIEQGRPHSMVLYGPPGSGKTTLARMLGQGPGIAFEELSAVQAGRAEVRAVIERAQHRRTATNVQTVLFLDEIHRFNKAQQDALLPAVEEGVITLIGATTENPAFEVNGALLSRVRVYALGALTAEQIATILRRTLEPQSGGSDASPGRAIAVDERALEFLAGRSEGDARTALNALELALGTARELGEERVGVERAQDALQRRAVVYDKGGDHHYDYISAWIKATRGSDVDASLYYLAVMLEGGEDPRFVVRRMVIFASEDIGNADPGALSVAVAAAQAVDRVGLPEARFALAQAAIYLALAPKSNAAGRALGAAERHVRRHGAAPVPAWLRSGPLADERAVGQESGDYEYPHDRPGGVSPQELMPEGVVGERFYEPREAEQALAARLREVRKLRGR